MELRRATKESKELKNISIQKFLKAFPRGFLDENYLSWERDFKWHTHERWQEVLNFNEFKKLMTDRDYGDVADRALNIVTSSNLLFPYEQMSLEEALKDEVGAALFAKGLYQLLYGTSKLSHRFSIWCETFEELPGIKTASATPKNKKQVVSWPVVTVFGFVAQPHEHIFLKPEIVTTAAEAYGFTLNVDSKPSWNGYSHYFDFCEEIKNDLIHLKPRDMIDIQSFIWVLGSGEY